MLGVDRNCVMVNWVARVEGSRLSIALCQDDGHRVVVAVEESTRWALKQIWQMSTDKQNSKVIYSIIIIILVYRYTRRPSENWEPRTLMSNLFSGLCKCSHNVYLHRNTRSQMWFRTWISNNPEVWARIWFNLSDFMMMMMSTRCCGQTTRPQLLIHG